MPCPLSQTHAGRCGRGLETRSAGAMPSGSVRRRQQANPRVGAGPRRRLAARGLWTSGTDNSTGSDRLRREAACKRTRHADAAGSAEWPGSLPVITVRWGAVVCGPFRRVYSAANNGLTGGQPCMRPGGPSVTLRRLWGYTNSAASVGVPSASAGELGVGRACCRRGVNGRREVINPRHSSMHSGPAPDLLADLDGEQDAAVGAVGNRGLRGFPSSSGRALCVHGSGGVHGPGAGVRWAEPPEYGLAPEDRVPASRRRPKGEEPNSVAVGADDHDSSYLALRRVAAQHVDEHRSPSRTGSRRYVRSRITLGERPPASARIRLSRSWVNGTNPCRPAH